MREACSVLVAGVLAATACAASKPTPAHPCTPAYRKLAEARRWLAAGDGARALATADAADTVCLREPGRSLRDATLRELGLPAPLREAFAAYRSALVEIDELARAGRLGQPLRDAEARRIAARARIDAGLVDAGLAAPEQLSVAAEQALVAALFAADRGNVTGAVARLAAVAPRDRHPDLDVVAAALLAREHPREAARHASRALFAIEWAGHDHVTPVRTLGDIGLPEAFAGSPDGTLVAAGNAGLAIWRGDTGELVHFFTTATPITAVAFSPGGRLVAFAGVGREIRIADLITGRVVIAFDRAPGHPPVRGIVFGPGPDELTLTAIPERDGVSGELATWTLSAPRLLGEWADMPAMFGPFVAGGAVIVGNPQTIVARSGDRVRWTAPGVEQISRDRDGSLWVAKGKRISQLDPATGRLQPHTTADATSLSWVGAAGYISRDRDHLYWYDLARKRATRIAALGYPDPTGVFALVARRDAAGISDARTGRHLGIEIGNHDAPDLRFIGANEVLVDDGGLLAALTSTGTTRACADDRWIVARKDTVATSPVVVRGRDGHALVDPKTCAVVRTLGEHAPDETSAVAEEVSRLRNRKTARDEVGAEIDFVARVVVDSNGRTAWLVGERGVARFAAGANAPDVQIEAKQLGVDIETKFDLVGGMIDVQTRNRNLRAVTAGGGRIALAWKTGGVTVTDGTTTWRIRLDDGAATIALSPDGKTLAIARARTLSWFDVETGALRAEAWRQGRIWRTVADDRIIGAPLRLGEPHELMWQIGRHRVPGFVAWWRVP